MPAADPPDDAVAGVRERYRRFAHDEAPHRSALYAAWARRVADEADLARILARIAPAHRQPPLVFAVTRMLECGNVDAVAWAAWLRAHADVVVAECATRALQTNEPLRCAALLPALMRIAGPVALLEVGASAGLCLYPDRYSYRLRADDGVAAWDPPGGQSPVVLHARWRGPSPTVRMPDVVWRAGIDLQPRDARDAADRAWLTGLVWPGETRREERVRAALDVVAADPPLLVAGDAADALPALAARAPKDATLVVTTPGVLVHIPRDRRERVVAAARGAGRWITLDAAGLHSVTAGAWHPPADRREWPDGAFALALDGVVIAAADPLGAIVQPISAARQWRATAREAAG